MAHKERTGKKASSSAAKTLRNPTSSKQAKAAAGSALTQRAGSKDNAGKETTGKKAASAAAKTLRNPKASKSARSAAGSALTQRRGKKH